MWATEAFFRYGGEPHFIFPTTVGPASQVLGGASPATPNMTQYTSSYPSPAPTSSSLAAPHVVGPLSSMATPPHPHPPPLTALSPATPIMLLSRLPYTVYTTYSSILYPTSPSLTHKYTDLCSPLWNDPVAVGYKPPGSMQSEQVRQCPHLVSKKKKKLLCC